MRGHIHRDPYWWDDFTIDIDDDDGRNIYHGTAGHDAYWDDYDLELHRTDSGSSGGGAIGWYGGPVIGSISGALAVGFVSCVLQLIGISTATQGIKEGMFGAFITATLSCSMFIFAVIIVMTLANQSFFSPLSIFLFLMCIVVPLIYAKFPFLLLKILYFTPRIVVGLLPGLIMLLAVRIGIGMGILVFLMIGLCIAYGIFVYKFIENPQRFIRRFRRHD